MDGNHQAQAPYGHKEHGQDFGKNYPNRVKGEERPKTLPILDVTARNPNV